MGVRAEILIHFDRRDESPGRGGQGVPYTIQCNLSIDI